MLSIISLTADYARLREGKRARVVARSNPVIGWAALSSRAGACQRAYRVRAGEYDSGWTASAEPFAKLPENALKPRDATRVSVEIEDDAGEMSAVYSDTLYNARTDWDADWITRENIVAGSVAYFRKRFTLKPGARAARVYVSALGYVNVKLNNEPLDCARLDPAFTDYSKRATYVYLPDIMDALRPGANELVCALAPGWRGDGVARFGEPRAFEGDAQFSLMLEIDYMSGARERVLTGEDWEAGEGAIERASLFDGERYDARRSALNNLAPAKRVPPPQGALTPMTIPPIISKAARAPVSIWPDGENAVILDFGQNIAGVLRVPLPVCENGRTVTLTHSEELDEDGRLYTLTLRGARARDEYVYAGDARDLSAYEPLFTYHGFRYARVEGLGAGYDARGVRAIELRTDVDARAHFTCGDALVSRIHDVCVATERANIHSILTDCPQRDERMGWLNDATVRFEATPYNFDVGALFPKVIRDIVDAQDSRGAIGCTAPFIWGAVPADPVCSSFLIAGREALMHTGNAEIIKEAYHAFCGWENYLLSRSQDYIVDYSYYGDWAGPADTCVAPSPSGDPGAVSAVTPGIFMSTGYSYFNCRLLHDFALTLGLVADARAHAETAGRIRDAIIRKWYDPDTGAFATGSQACQAFALWLDISPDKAKTARALADAVRRAGHRLTTGNLCSRYVMDALSDNGYIEDAWKLITRVEYPSIGYMIAQEATTVWERFELMKHPGMNSHNHPMYAAVDYWLYARVIGVRPTAPGWREFEVRPNMPECLLSAQASIETPLGDICVRVTKRYGSGHISVRVPFGARARVVFMGREEMCSSGFFTLSVTD